MLKKKRDGQVFFDACLERGCPKGISVWNIINLHSNRGEEVNDDGEVRITFEDPSGRKEDVYLVRRGRKWGIPMDREEYGEYKEAKRARRKDSLDNRQDRKKGEARGVRPSLAQQPF